MDRNYSVTKLHRVEKKEPYIVEKNPAFLSLLKVED